MNEGQYMAMIAEARETNSLLKQILEALQKQSAPSVDVPAEAVGPVTVETVDVVDAPKPKTQAKKASK